MLDKNTLEWLENREDFEKYGGYYCVHCFNFKEDWDSELGHCESLLFCPVENSDYRDNSEFDSKVIECLSNMTDSYVPCYRDDVCPYGKDFWNGNCEPACRQRIARLTVEKEMENLDECN